MNCPSLASSRKRDELSFVVGQLRELLDPLSLGSDHITRQSQQIWCSPLGFLKRGYFAGLAASPRIWRASEAVDVVPFPRDPDACPLGCRWLGRPSGSSSRK